MSLEQKLEDLTNAVKLLTDTLLDCKTWTPIDEPEPVPEPTPLKTRKPRAKKEEQKPLPLPAPVVSEPVVSEPVVSEPVALSDVIQVLTELGQAKGRDAIVAALNSVGAPNVGALKPDQYAAVVAIARDMLQ